MSDALQYPTYLYPNLCALQMLGDGVFSSRAINTYLATYPLLVGNSCPSNVISKHLEDNSHTNHGERISAVFTEMVKQGYLYGSHFRGYRMNDTALRDKQLLQFLREHNNGRLQNLLESA
jgi:hypothetical protein